MSDLAGLFRFSVDPLEIVIRGTAVYWFLFLLFRFVLRRDVGSIAIADVLLLVLLADAAQNAMAGGYESIVDGFVLVATIGGWNWLVDWASFRFAFVRNVLEPRPLPLIRDGRVLRANLRRELISDQELRGELRQHGLDDYSQVKLAVMEGDGKISVVKFEAESEKKAGGPIAGG